MNRNSLLLLLLPVVLVSCKHETVSEIFPPTIEIDPKNAETGETGKVQLTALVRNATPNAVLWEVLSQTGNITSQGLYLAPQHITGDSAVVIIRGKLALDNSISDMATIIVRNTIADDSIPGDTTTNPPPQGLSFSTQIKPILLASCAYSGCHAGNNPQEDLNFSTYNGVMETVEAFDPHDSELYKAITEDEEDEIMPPSGQLPQTQINLIRQWIEEGAKNN